MPYRPHSEYPSPYQPQAVVKKRPSWVWFLVGGLLMVAAAVIAGVTFIRLGLDISRTDAVFPASGVHAVNLPADSQRGLYIEEGHTLPRCNVSDSSGNPLQFRRPDSRFTYNQWVAVRVFDTGSGSLQFDCGQGQSGQLRIAQVLTDGDLARAGVIGFFVPLVIGGIGFVIVLVTAILFFTRRRQNGPPGPPPGWQPAPAQAWPPSGYQAQPQQPGQAWPPAQQPPQQAPPPQQPGQPGQPGRPDQPGGMPGWP